MSDRVGGRTPGRTRLIRFPATPWTGRSIHGHASNASHGHGGYRSSRRLAVVDRSGQLVGDVEREAYLARLRYALPRTDWVLLGYALMSSHVHVVLEAGAGSLGSWTKSAYSRTARWLNARHGRLGPVFADRPYAEAVDDSRVPYLLAYVHNNPVRARLVGSADESSWTSHRAYLGLAPARAGLRSKGAVVVATPRQGAEGMRAAVVVPHSAVWWPRPSHITPESVIAAVRDLTGIDPRGSAARDRRPAVTAARRAALAAWAHIGGARIQMARSLGIGAAAASDLVHRRPGRLQAALLDDLLARLVPRVVPLDKFTCQVYT